MYNSYVNSNNWWLKMAEDDSTLKNKWKRENKIFSFDVWFSRNMDLKIHGVNHVSQSNFKYVDFNVDYFSF